MGLTIGLDRGNRLGDLVESTGWVNWLSQLAE